MKRFAFWFVAALLAVNLVRSNSSRDRQPLRPHVVVIHDEGEHGRVTRTVVGSASVGIDEAVRQATEDARRAIRDAARDAEEAAEDAKEAAEEAIRDAKRAAHEAAEDVRRAAREAKHDVHGHAREFVEGLPVPVVPGTRVTEARPEPPVPPSPPRRQAVRVRIGHTKNPPTRPKPAPKVEPITVAGRLSATESRAKEDARRALVETIRGKLEGRVDPSWVIPDSLVDGMIRDVKVSPVEKEYGTMYEAKLTVDASPSRVDEIHEAFRHEQRLKRLAILGGGLLFLLVGLGSFSGYVRADEATKGYFTNRLRLASTLALGAAGVAIYRLLS
jgi:ElaB/YqjD/DUF883 family membrane-anchored ribosome-binding protein